MLPIMSNDLEKAALREVISLAASIVGSGTLVVSKGVSGVVFRGFGIMVLESSVIMGMMLLVVPNAMCFHGFDCWVMVSMCAVGFHWIN